MNKIEQSVRERFTRFTTAIRENLLVITSSIAIATMLIACNPRIVEGQNTTKTPNPTKTPTNIVLKATPIPIPTVNFKATSIAKSDSITTTVELTQTNEITSNLTILLDPYNFYPDKNQSELMKIIEGNASKRISILVDAGLVFTNSVTSEPITFSGVVKWRQAESTIPEVYQLVIRDSLGNSMHINKETGDVIYSMKAGFNDASHAGEYHDILYGLQSQEIRAFIKNQSSIILQTYGAEGRMQERILGTSNCIEGAKDGKTDCVHEIIRKK